MPESAGRGAAGRVQRPPGGVYGTRTATHENTELGPGSGPTGWVPPSCKQKFTVDAAPSLLPQSSPRVPPDGDFTPDTLKGTAVRSGGDPSSGLHLSGR